MEDHHRDHHEASGGEAVEQQHSEEVSKDNEESNSHPSATGTLPESSTVPGTGHYYGNHMMAVNNQRPFRRALCPKQ
jgi:hypothetical protein